MNILRYSFVSFAQLLYPFEFLLGTRTCCFILSPFQYFKELICLVLHLVFEAKADAKINTLFHPIQIFLHLFSNFFSELPFLSGSDYVRHALQADINSFLGRKRVQIYAFFMNFQIIIGVFLKVYAFSHLHAWERTFLDNLKHWISIYQPPLSPPLLQSVVPDCGCKDKPIISPFPNFFTPFFKLFSINMDRRF